MTAQPQPPQQGASGLGPNERRWLLAFLVIGATYFGLLLFERLIGVLGGFASIGLILFLAWLLAFVMAPLVSWLEQRLSLPRPAIVVGTYLVALVVFGFVVFYIGAAITQQVAELAERYPETEDAIIAQLTEWEQSLVLGRLEIDLVGLYEGAIESAEELGAQLLEQAQAIAAVTLAALGSLFLIIVLSLYMLMDSQRILARARGLVPRRYSDEAELFERSTARAFGGFLRAQLVLAALQGALVGVIGTIFGIPFLFLWGTLSALLMLIPFFGPPLALIPPAIGGILFGGTGGIIAVVILIVAQTILVNWLQPRLMRGALGLHPILVLVGLLIGAQVAGVWGALFAIPVIAVVWVFVTYVVFGAVPNAALPEEKRLADVDEHVMVSVAREQVGDETHPHIHVTRTRRPDGTEQVELRTEPRSEE